MARRSNPREDAAILDAIWQHWAAHGYGPTYRSLAAELGRPWTTVRDRTKRFRSVGLVTHEPGRFRTLRLTELGRRYLQERPYVR